MKRVFILMMMAVAMVSCSSNDNQSSDNAAGDNATTGTDAGGAGAQATDISSNPDYKKGLALIGQNDCLGCHKVSEKLVGPSYQEVADRYAGQPGAADSLANKIIHGGAGNWGEVAMTPHANLSHEDAVAMAKYILLLKQ